MTMCKHYINIKHPALPFSLDGAGNNNYIEGFTPSTLTVPCGYCMQCQELKNKEWRLRLSYELDAVKAVGGYCFKEELTYSNEHVSKIGEFMVFNKTHIREFIKSLRVYLYRKFKRNIKIHYFVCCEYGGNFTHRPHYHILLFIFDSEVGYIYLNNLIRKLWKYGYTNQNKGRKAKPDWSVKDKIVQDYRACEYVTKYLFKDRNFFDGLLNQEDKTVLNYVSSALNSSPEKFLSDYTNDSNLYIKVIRILRNSPFADSIPFRCQSQGIGLNMLSHISFDDACRGMFNDIHSSKLQYLPMYIKRKLLYDYNRHTKCFVKSERFINYLWQKKMEELNEPHSLLLDFPKLPDSLLYTYNTFLDRLSNDDMYILYDFYTLLNTYCPHGYKVDIHQVDLQNVIYHYKLLFPLLQKRDLFYSSLLRCQFNVNDLIVSDVEPFELDSIDVQLRKYFVKPIFENSSITIFFQRLDAWNREQKEILGDLICQQIKEKYDANKFDYTAT